MSSHVSAKNVKLPHNYLSFLNVANCEACRDWHSAHRLHSETVIMAPGQRQVLSHPLMTFPIII